MNNSCVVCDYCIEKFYRKVAMPELITLKNNNGISRLTLNRPGQRSALSETMRQECIAALTEFNGAGDRAFCAGQDLKEVAALNTNNASEWQDQLRAFLTSIRNLDKPCIAAINGAAIGIGFYAALLCDIRIAHKEILMGQTEINVGFESIIGTRLISITLGRSTTVELSLTDRPLSNP